MLGLVGLLSAVATQFGRLFHMFTTLLVKQYLRKSFLNGTFCNLISLPLVLNVHALFSRGTRSSTRNSILNVFELSFFAISPKPIARFRWKHARLSLFRPQPHLPRFMQIHPSFSDLLAKTTFQIVTIGSPNDMCAPVL